MCIQIKNRELSLEEKKLLLKPVEEILKSRPETEKIFFEPLMYLFADNEGGQPPFVYRHFIKSLLHLMASRKNAAKLDKTFGHSSTACFYNLLLFFELLERQPVNELIDYIHCTTYTGHLNGNDVYKLRKKYLNDKS